MDAIVSGLYAVYIAYDVLDYTLQRSQGWTQLIVFSGHVFPLKITRGKQSRIRPWQEKVAQLYVWLVIHYLDFDSVAP